jgi:hypothetical protein
MKAETKPKPFLIRCSGCKTTIRINWPRPVITCRKCQAVTDVQEAQKAFYKHREKKVQKQKEAISCDCGNNISVMSGKSDVKCFKCNYLWAKFDGEWVKTQFRIGRDDLTLAHAAPPELLKRLRIHPNELVPQPRRARAN